jgi:pyruvate,water dikinase
MLAAQLTAITANDPEQTCYAVRSSSLAEDTADRSFAGLFDTFLFVRKSELAAHVSQCRASASSERVQLYRGAAENAPMSVIVQQMVRSQAAGVLFTANPAGALTETIIVAAYGLGEGVVQDRVETDTFVLDRITGKLRIETTHKTKKVGCPETACGSADLMAVPPELADQPVLTETEVLMMADTGASIGRLYENPFVDIEWCLDEQRRLHILQCRPVTTIPAGEFTLIDNSNIIEGYPGITQALTFSILKDGYRKNVTALACNIGIQPRAIDAARRALEHMVAYVEGRVYYNLTSWHRIFDLMPGCGKWLCPLFDTMIGAAQGIFAAALPAAQRLSIRHARQFIRVGSRILSRFLFSRRSTRQYQRESLAIQSMFRSRRIESLTNHELIELWLQLDTRIFRIIHIPLLNDLFLMLLVPATKKALAWAGMPDAENLFNALMCSGKTMESVLPVHSILLLAEQARSCSELAQALRLAVASQQSGNLDELFSRYPEFARDFHAHIDLYGDRLPQELKIETISFRENPLLFAEAILRQMDADMTVSGLHAREQDVREEAEVQLSRGLAGKPLQRMVTRYLLQKTRQGLASRECARLDRARFFGMFRALARAMGRNLAREKAILDPRDVNHLTIEELKDYIMGAAATTDLKSLIALRKKQLDIFKERIPDERMLLRGTVYRNFIVHNQLSGASGTLKDTAGAQLQGIPCSPGMVEAEALIVNSPDVSLPVKGKILVARMTDPGWVFLMVSAAGLIVERGSLLSHTAIIGRELGIPTIVGVADACRKICTGSRIRMDGSTGHIITNC